jgi:5-methylcytosine-specific restriction endonuclease McrA
MSSWRHRGASRARPMTPRQRARNEGLNIFSTGKPCKNGHIADRYVKSGSCVECCNAWNNDVRHRLQCREWRANNKPRVKELNDRWYSHRLETTRKWKEKNPEAVSLHDRISRARRRGAIGTHTAADIRNILRFQKRRCAYCRTRLADTGFHVDHIIALARGGTNYKENLQILCPTCNLKKHARDPIEFAQSKGMLL